MNIMMILKRKTKVDNEPENNRRGDSGTSRLKKAAPLCRPAVSFTLLKNGFIENNPFHLYSRHESTLHTRFLLV